MVYNMTTIATNSSSGIVGLVQGVNDSLMFGWWGTMLLIAIFFITMMSFYYTTRDVPRSMMGSSFIVFGSAVFLRALSLITGKTLYITLIACAIIAAFTWKAARNE